MRSLSVVRAVSLLLVLFVAEVVIQSQYCLAQSGSANGDATALSIAHSFLVSTVGNQQVQSFQSLGSAQHFIGGNSSSASIRIESASPFRSRIDVTSVNGTRTEIKGYDGNGMPAGVWTTSAGSKSIVFQNLYQDDNWFFPALTSLGQLTDSSLTFQFIGSESWNGVSVLHVRVTRTVASVPAMPAITTDYYLNSSSRLLLRMTCALYPDNGANTQILREVDYSNYVESGGVMVPTTINRYLNGSLELSVTLSSIEINPTLPQSDFQVN